MTAELAEDVAQRHPLHPHLAPLAGRQPEQRTADETPEPSL